MELEGTAAVATGAGSGVGRATALALARRGCRVVVNDLDGSVTSTASPTSCGRARSAGRVTGAEG